MARTEIPVQAVSRTVPVVASEDGFGGTDSDPDNGHSMLNRGHTLLYVTSNIEDDVTINIHVAEMVDGLAVSDLVHTVPGLGGMFVGPFPSAQYNFSNKIELDVSGNPGDVSLVGLRLR